MRPTLFDTGRASGADLSACGRYRYRLWREWSDADPVNWIMLNPSTADEVDDDATIKRCIRFARDWGYGGIRVTNLYAFRATYPRDLWKAADPVGERNNRAIASESVAAGLVVCAWGNHGAVGGRAAVVLADLRAAGITPHRLTVTSNGQPGHPLRLPASLRPEPF